MEIDSTNNQKACLVINVWFPITKVECAGWVPAQLWHCSIMPPCLLQHSLIASTRKNLAYTTYFPTYTPTVPLTSSDQLAPATTFPTWSCLPPIYPPILPLILPQVWSCWLPLWQPALATTWPAWSHLPHISPTWHQLPRQVHHCWPTFPLCLNHWRLQKSAHFVLVTVVSWCLQRLPWSRFCMSGATSPCDMGGVAVHPWFWGRCPVFKYVVCSYLGVETGVGVIWARNNFLLMAGHLMMEVAMILALLIDCFPPLVFSQTKVILANFALMWWSHLRKNQKQNNKKPLTFW